MQLLIGMMSNMLSLVHLSGMLLLLVLVLHLMLLLEAVRTMRFTLQLLMKMDTGLVKPELFLKRMILFQKSSTVKTVRVQTSITEMS
jgi:hypothetical protein